LFFNKVSEGLVSHDFIFYIENTYIFQHKHVINDLPNHRIIWDTILELGFEKNIGFCLDWGHVKAFSNDKLINWIDFAKYLKLKGMPIYMHIHDNDGIKDLHCSLKEGKELNLDSLNKAKDLPFLETLKNVKDFFGNDSLILEYKSNIAEEHYNWTKNNIA